MSAQGNLVPFIQPADTSEQEMEMFLRSVDPELPITDPADDSQATLDLVIDRYFEMIAERDAKIAVNAEIARRKIEMIQKWEQDANGAFERENQWLWNTIRGLTRSYDYGKKKSRTLPHGEFGNRWQGPTIEIVDMDKAVAFAESKGLEIKKTVNKTPLLKHLEATKEMPAGCVPVPGEDRFFAKVSA
jgi:hypothetical protein